MISSSRRLSVHRASAVLTLLCMSLPLTALAGELSIRGRLVDENGKLVKGAPLAAVCIGALPEGPKIDCSFPTLMGRQGTTDDKGSFSLEKLPPAVYTLAVSIPRSGGETAYAELRVPLSQSVDGILLRLHVTRSISGVVVDTRDEPLEDVQVTVTSKDADESHAIGSDTTDTQGRFRIPNLADARYSLEAKGNVIETFRLTGLLRPEGTPMRIRVQRCPTVRGRAVKPDGTPVPHVLSESFEYLGNKRADGRFEDYYCCHDSGQVLKVLTAPGMSRTVLRFSLEKGQVLDLGDVRMELARELKLRLIDMSTGKAVAGGSVSVVAGGSVPVEDSEPSPVYNVDGTGLCEISNYPDQELDLRVQPPRGFIATKVHVRKGQTEVKVALDPGKQLRGRALDDAGKPLMGTVQVGCDQGGADSAELGPEGEFHLVAIRGGVCTFYLYLMPHRVPTSFEQMQMIWVDPKRPAPVELRVPSRQHSLRIRFQGQPRPDRLAIYMGDLPAQVDLASLAERSQFPVPFMQENVYGFQRGQYKEDSFHFERVGEGRHTLLGVKGKESFRIPITVGKEEETLTVEVPPQRVKAP